MKGAKWIVSTGFILLLCQACAVPDVPLKIGNMQSINSLQVVRAKPPGLEQITPGAQAIAFAGMMFGAMGAGLGGAISESMEIAGGKALARKCHAPDFGRLVLDDFAAGVPKRLPGWPKLIVTEDPVSANYQPEGYTILLRVVNMQVNKSTGFESYIVAKMTDPQKKIVWKKGFLYKSGDYSRSGFLRKPEAEHGKPLRDEMRFAAEKTASVLIDHLEYSGKPTEKKPQVTGN